MSGQKTKTPARNQLYGLIHTGAKRLLGLNQMLKEDAERTYRDWLEANSAVYGLPAKRSCKDMLFQQLTHLKDLLQKQGALDKSNKPDYPSNKRRNAPTTAQWRKLAALAREKGFGGLNSPQLLGFIKRTAKVEKKEFLTKPLMSQCITGLEKWVNS